MVKVDTTDTLLRLVAPILVVAGRVGFALPLTPENANRETFRKHLSKADPALSAGVMYLLPSELNRVLEEYKHVYDQLIPIIISLTC